MFTTALFASLLATSAPADQLASGRVQSDCTCRGHQLSGRVQVVTAHADLRVQVVTAFPDLRVQRVKAHPDRCGQWQMVEAFPDLKVQFVEAFPDLKVQFVDAFPGMPHATAPAPAWPAVANAERDVAMAAELVRTCDSEAACAVARQLGVAADAELEAARTLAGPELVAGDADPFAPAWTYVEPFEDFERDAREGMAAFELAAVQARFDFMTR